MSSYSRSPSNNVFSNTPKFANDSTNQFSSIPSLPLGFSMLDPSISVNTHSQQQPQLSSTHSILDVSSGDLASLMSAWESDPLLSTFLHPSFSPKDHVNRVVQSGDLHSLQAAVERAERATNHISSQVRGEVIRRQQALFGEVEAVGALEKEVSTLQIGVTNLVNDTNQLVDSLDNPHTVIQGAVQKMENLHNASNILGQIITFKNCVVKLKECGMLSNTKSSAITVKNIDSDKKSAKNNPSLIDTEIFPSIETSTLILAAEAVQDIDHVLKHHQSDLEKIDAIRKDIPTVKRTHDLIKHKAVDILHSGLLEKSQRDVGIALQALEKLGGLSGRVNEEMARLFSEAQAAVQAGFDPNIPLRHESLTESSKQAKSTTDKKADIWVRIAHLCDQLFSYCSQTIILQVTLEKRYDSEHYQPLIHYIDGGADSYIASSFLEFICGTVADQVKIMETAKKRTVAASTFNTMTLEYPRLRALFLRLADRIANTAVVMSASWPMLGYEKFSKASVEEAVLKTIEPVELSYLAASLSRLTDMISTSFTPGKPCPKESDIFAFVKLLATEHSLALEDENLSACVLKNIAKAISMFTAKAESSVAGLHNVKSKDGLFNQDIIALYNGLNLLYTSAHRLFLSNEAENFDKDAIDAVANVLAKLSSLADEIIHLPFTNCRKVIENILYDIDIGDLTIVTNEDWNCSNRIEEVCDIIDRLRNQFITKLQCSTTLITLSQEFASRVLTVFLRILSLFYPVSQDKKMILIGDMSQMEMTISGIASLKNLAKPHDALRAFRRLLFMETEELLTFQTNNDIKSLLKEMLPSTVMHHIFSRSPPALQHPHHRLSWTVSRYSQWMDEHSESEIYEMILESVQKYKSLKTPDDSNLCPECQLLIELGEFLMDEYKAKTGQ